jgi:hypothetical protein
MDGSSGPPPRGSGISLLPRVGEHPGFTLWRVSIVLVAAMLGLAFAHVQGWVAWTVLTVLVGWCVTWAHPWTALAAGAETWLVETGFGVHGHGELTFAREDLTRLMVVVAVTVLVAVVTRRLGRGLQTQAPLDRREHPSGER